MATIVDYASLTTAVSDFLHRTDVAAGTYTDYFIQGAIEQLQNDIFADNFGNGIRAMEYAYPATPIVGGVAPVPGDWLAPKLMTVTDGAGDVFTLIFKSAAWIYDQYPQRQASGLPAYIARDIVNSALFPGSSFAFVATAGQTHFNVASAGGSIYSPALFVAQAGQVLVPETDYTLAAGVLTLGAGAVAGQTILVQYPPYTVLGSGTSAYTLSFTASAGQSAFPLSPAPPNPTVVLATLAGQALTPGADYTVSGGILTLTDAALAGQALVVQFSLGATTMNGFIFAPYPDANYQIQGTYYQSAPMLSLTQTTNWMVSTCPTLLHAACMVKAGEFLIDDSLIARFTPMYQSRLQGLIERDKAERWASSTMQIELG